FCKLTKFFFPFFHLFLLCHFGCSNSLTVISYFGVPFALRTVTPPALITCSQTALTQSPVTSIFPSKKESRFLFTLPMSILPLIAAVAILIAFIPAHFSPFQG